MSTGLTLYEIIWFFLLYSFFGWLLEVVYQAVSKGKIINRGFLNGPVCPIYGFGIISIYIFFNSISPDGIENIHGVILFVLGTAIATLIELFGGWALDKLFHARWWDYSKEPFNLNGYVCPKFSLYWGLIIVFVVRIFHPFIASHTVEIWPEKYGWPVAGILSCVYFADFVVTVLIVSGLNREIEQLDTLQQKMRRTSDSLSTVLGSNALKTVQRIQTGRIKVELAKEEFLDQAAAARERAKVLSAERRSEVEAEVTSLLHDEEEILDGQARLYERLAKNRFFGTKRLLAAFPDMRSTTHKDALEAVKNELNN